MQSPLQILFRNLGTSPAVETKIRERVDELERIYDRITSCRVVVEAPNRPHREGRLYHVSIDLKVPGREIVVNRDPSEHHAHEDVDIAVHDCFDAVRRQLQDHVRRERGDIKVHEAPAHGRIVSLMAEEDYGFIDAGDDGEVYFHRNAVAGKGFDKLVVGDEVRFALHPGEGEKGPQASAVAPIGRHHLLSENP